MDVNVLYIDHNYGITLICQSHLANGDHLFQPMADISDTDVGSERLVAVINESGKDLTDLSFLTQPGLREASRGAEPEGLMAMLSDLGSGVPTRGPTIAASSSRHQDAARRGGDAAGRGAGDDGRRSGIGYCAERSTARRKGLVPENSFALAQNMRSPRTSRGPSSYSSELETYFYSCPG